MRLRILTITVVGAIASGSWIVPGTLRAEEPPRSVRPALRAEGFGAPLKLTATATVTNEDEPCFDLADPTSTDVVTVSVDGAVKVLSSQRFYLQAPTYRAPQSERSREIDYDEQGRLLVWRSLATERLVTPERNDALSTLRLFRVEPGGEVRPEATTHRQLRRFQGSILSEVDLVLLALGSGYSSYLRQAPVIEKLGGRTMVKAAGSLGADLTGSWELTLDEADDGIVRKARFRSEGERPQILEINTRGTMENGGVRLAREGEVKLGREEEWTRIVVRLESVSPHFDEALLQDVSGSLSRPLPFRSEILDLRGKTTVREFVGDTEIIGEEETCCVCEAVNVTLSECGHLKDSTVCSSGWCIQNVVTSATCKNTRPSGITSCPIVSPVPVQPMVVQTPVLLTNNDCPKGGQAVKYAVKLTTYDGCSACTPTAPFNIRTACDVDSCPAGAALDRCATPRGIRRACS